MIEGHQSGPSHREPSGSTTIILFHGYGANGADLAPLAFDLQAPHDTRWIFPNGPQKIPLGSHGEGRGWFPIPLSELERAMATGAGADFSEVVPPGFKKAREAALELIDALNVPTERLLLGGFSQGAMLATDLVMTMDAAPAGLAILSGSLVNASRWRELAPRHKGFKFFQSHGTRDPVLSFALAQRLESLLLEAGWQGKLQSFQGAHEIPHEILYQLARYVKSVCERGSVKEVQS